MRAMYWINVLLVLSAMPLVGWLTYGFVDSIQRNDSRGIQIWLSVTGFLVAILVVLVIAGAISL